MVGMKPIFIPVLNHNNIYIPMFINIIMEDKFNIKDLKELGIKSLRSLIDCIVNEKFSDEDKVEFFELFESDILNFLANKVKELEDEGDLIKDMDTLVVGGRK